MHGSHPRPYFEMKPLLTQTYGITDQQRYASLTKMTLGSDKPSTLLRKMKSTFRGERLTNAISELLRGLFLQALPKSVKLHLVAETNLTLDNLAIKADAIFLELFPNNISTVASPEFIPSTSSTNKTSGSDVSLSPGVKKRVKWLATILSRKPHDLLFFVQDKLSGMKFLVDSGSMVSVENAARLNEQMFSNFL